MKLKLKSVLVGVLALVQSGAIAAIATTTIVMTPVAAKAQTASFTDVFPILSGVELTTQQKIQLIELASNVQSQIGQIVTPEQQNRFRTALGQGQGFAEAIAAMNITPDQQTRLQGVLTTVRPQIVSTFTQTQRQKILENVRSLLQL
jgi:hypothetical protein